MTTNANMIGDALGMLGVLTETESLSAEQGEHGLRVLNDLLTTWEAEGLGISYIPQTNVAAAFPLDASLELAVKSNLAVQLAPYYQREAPPTVQRLADMHYRRLLSDAQSVDMPECSLANRPAGSGQVLGSDFEV